MAISYPISSGNWSIALGVTDSITDAKAVSIPDIDWASDFGKWIKPLKPEDGVSVSNVTSTSLTSNERFRFNRTRIANVYNRTDVPLVRQLDVVEGVKAFAEFIHYYPATNSVSGDEVIIPVVASYTLTVPSDIMVNQDFVEGAFIRSLAGLFDTGDTGAERIIEVLQGQLLPSCSQESEEE